MSSLICCHIKRLLHNTYLYIHVYTYIFICIYIYINVYLYVYTYIYWRYATGRWEHHEVRTRGMPFSYVWHILFIHICGVLPFPLRHWPVQSTRAYVRRASFIFMTWLIHTFDLTYPYVWHDLSIRLTCLIHMCIVTDAYLWRDSFRCATWLVYICGMIHSDTCRVILAHMRDIIHYTIGP